MADKRTITSMFIVPTLGIPLTILKSNGYINGYSKDSKRTEQYEDAVYLLFKPNDLLKFKDFLEAEYDRTEDIIDDYDYNNGYVVVVYKLDMDFEKDFKFVKNGKYSKTSTTFQKMFPTNVRIPHKEEELSLQYRVFNKTKDLVTHWEDLLEIVLTKDHEVWDMFEIEKETLNLEL